MTAIVAHETALSLREVGKTFADRSGRLETLRDVSFDVGFGEFYAIVGPSGCGKSTLLNIIAGLEQEDRGEIRLAAGIGASALPDRSGIRSSATEGRPYPRDAQSDMANPGPGTGALSESLDRRLGRVAYMPQKDLLLPWRTVLGNAALGLELTGTPRAAARERAGSLLARFGLDGFGDAFPSTLSGGMRQRAAFLRTVVTERDLMLLDEPFGALDALTRRSMQEWLLNIWSELRRTVVLITHDVEEAILLSDRVAVMSARPGSIVQTFAIDLPRPRNPDVVTDPAFVAIKRDVLAALREGMDRGADAPE